jgi:hypothetical protein
MARGNPAISNRLRAEAAREAVVQRYSTVRTLIRTAGGVGAIYILQGFFLQIAGHDTAVALNLSFLGDMKFVGSFALGGGGCAWAAVERTLRHRKVEALQGRIRELELAIDPNRSTSGLTPKGKTNPKDKTS